MNNEVLLKSITDLIKMKSVSGYVLYIILMSLAMLAIFDTQVLSIFRRQKEIGTYIALGMTRRAGSQAFSPLKVRLIQYLPECLRHFMEFHCLLCRPARDCQSREEVKVLDWQWQIRCIPFTALDWLLRPFFSSCLQQPL